MAGRFLLHRSALARTQAQREMEVSDQRVARLAALATALADRMDVMPSAGLQHDLERRARVEVLRRTAAAGRRALAARGDARSDAPRGERSA